MTQTETVHTYRHIKHITRSDGRIQYEMQITPLSTPRLYNILPSKSLVENSLVQNMQVTYYNLKIQF